MKTFFLFFFLTVATGAWAQKALPALETLYQKYPQEKVVLAFSKNDYIAGETVSFKAYVLTGYAPSEISTNLYTELYDKNKTLLDKRLVPLFRGSGEGFFALPPSLAEDVYYIRAYTQHMLNFDENFQYLQPVAVYNPASLNKLAPMPVQWTAAAFAEGGTLLNEVPATVAVRLFTNGRLPQSWQAVLREKESGAAVDTVEILNGEVGTVSFLPMSGKAYAIAVTDNLGNEKSVDVPKVADTGSVLQLTVKGDKLRYAIYIRNIASRGEGYKLLGSVHDEAVFSADIKKSSGRLGGEIDLSALPPGVLRVTLFDEAERPVNERLCFLRPELNAVAPALTTDTLSFAAKGLNHWRLPTDSLGWISYQVQVSDAGYPFAGTFLDDVYLRSDFPSSVHQAPAYLPAATAKMEAALDALLVTERWRRFHWNDLLAGRFPSLKFQPDRYLSYSAAVRKGKSRQPLREMNLVFQSKGSALQVVPVKADSAGGFRLDDLVFTDTAKVYYQAANRKFLEREVEIDFEPQNKFRPYAKSLPPSAWQLVRRPDDDTVAAHLKWSAAQRNTERVLQEKEKMLQEVVVSARARSATEELDDKLGSGLFYSDNAMLFDFINDDQASAFGYNNILEWLNGRLPGYRTELRDGELIPTLRSAPTQIYLDELPVEPDVLNGYSASDIALIKVIRGVFLGGRGGNGAIVIYTRRGGMQSKSSAPSLSNNILLGYQTPPPFFSPDYSLVSPNVSDRRHLLFRSAWLSPADKTYIAPIRFYNNDDAKSFRLLVTGFTGDGRPVFLDKLIR